ncbi:MAG: FAD-binding oxidoreductase [Chloroflexi bacterium]|nr:FAD-binding oxidoreductase [Chloroflexota bacterium]
MAETADVVVIGGGCIGTSIAWQLAGRGAGRVVLLEKSGIAAGATGWSSAIVRMHYVHEPLIRMALFGRRMFENFADEVGGDCGFRRVGFLVLVPQHEVPVARRVVGAQKGLGIDATMLSPEEISEIEPRLSLEGVAAGTWEPDSGHADGTGTASAFAQAARQAGADLRIGVEVTSVQAVDGGSIRVATAAGDIEAGSVVLAAGYRTSALLKRLGVELPIKPVRHSIAVVERSAAFGAPHPVVSDRVQRGYYRPEGSGLALLGDHDPLEGEIDHDIETDKPPPPDAIARLTGRFAARFPSEADATYRRGYTGVYDTTPDFQPALGAVKAVPGLYVAAGFSGHGFKLSPAVGRMLSDVVLDGDTQVADISMFRVERFAEGKLVAAPEGYGTRSLA